MSKYDIKVDSDDRNPCVTGISVTTDGQIILVDQDNLMIKMIAADRRRIFNLDLKERCCDVTVYNDNTAVVTGDFTLFFTDIPGT